MEYKNFAYSLVATAPSPAASGTSLVVTSGEGILFPSTPFYATIWPAGVMPSATNAEIVLVTNVSTDTFTITRQQEGTSARTILVGDRIANTITADTIDDKVTKSGDTMTGQLTLVASTTDHPSFNIPAGTAPTVPTAGDMWNDSTQLTIMNFTSGIKQYIGGTIFVQTADKVVANTASETTLVGTGLGTTTLPTDFFVAGRAFRITANGFYSTRHDATTLTVKIKLGNTVILTTGAASMAVDIVNKAWSIPVIDITCRSVGETGTVIANGFINFATVAKGSTIDQFTPNTSAVVINTTTTQAISVTAQWGHADLSNVITSTNLAIASLN